MFFMNSAAGVSIVLTSVAGIPNFTVVADEMQKNHLRVYKQPYSSRHREKKKKALRTSQLAV